MRRSSIPRWFVRWRLPVAVTVGYLIFSVLWIAISDAVVLRMVEGEAQLTVIQTYKGWAYVTASAAFLFSMLAVALTRLFRTEQALERTRIEYRHLISAISDGIWIRDTDGRTLFVNDSLARMVDVDHATLMKSGLLPYMRTSAGQPMIDADDLPSTRTKSIQIVRIEQSGGGTNWALLSSNPIHGKGGELLGELSIVMDITERIANERALQEANESQRRLLEELHHRVRNNLSSLHGLIDMTRINAVSPETMMDRLHSRISAMTSAHELLSESNWKPVSLIALLGRLIEGPYERCVRRSGTDVLLRPEFVSPLAGVVAELFSRARLLGSIRSFVGSVTIRWTLPGEACDINAGQFTLEWIESGQSGHAGGDTNDALELVRGLVSADLRGSLSVEHGDDRLVVRIELPASVVAQQAIGAGA